MLFLGVSGEEEKPIQDVFVNQLGAKYPIVRVNKQDVAKYGIRAYPSVYVLDPNGVVWSVPDQGMPGDQQLEELLKTVTMAPKMPEDARYDPLRALWKKGEYLKVRDYLDKNLAAPNLDAAMKDVFTAQREQLDKRQEATLARIPTLAQGDDFAAAEDQLESIEKKWKGLPPAEAAAKERARYAADPAIKKELNASRALQKLVDSFDVGKVAQKKKLIEALGQFRKKYEGTQAAKAAEAKLTALAGKG